MNTTEKLLTEILAELRKQNVSVETPQQDGKRWKPIYGKTYYYIDCYGEWESSIWDNDSADLYRYNTGNCYQIHEEERAIWEQVTRRQYEQALRDAADWVNGEWYYGLWNNGLDTIMMSSLNYNMPRFATEQSCIEAHARILGDDAKRYFTG